MTQPLSRTHKIVLLGALYLAQGLPYGFFTLALPIFLRKAGFSLVAISATSLLYLPWVLKFLWAPYVDQIGSRKVWFLCLQTSSVIGAVLLSFTDINAGYVAILIGAFAFNLIAATQDIVTDGTAVRLLDDRDRGLANGLQVGAYRVGMTMGAGGLLLVYDRLGWSTMFLTMAALLAVTIVPVLMLRADSIPRAQPAELPSFARLAIQWFERLLVPGMLAFAALIFCFRFGDAMVSTLLSPFVTDLQLSIETIALMKGTVGNVTSIVGAIIGGWFVFRMPRRTAILAAGLGQAVTFIPYWLAAFGIGGVDMMWGATIVEGIVSTMATVALFTLMMDASDPDHAGTDYTLLASIYVLVTSAGQFFASVIADLAMTPTDTLAGYRVSFAIGVVLTIIGTLLLVFTLDRRPMPARVAKVWERRAS